MKNIILVLFTAIFIYGCSGTKDLQLGTLSQEPCRSEANVSETNVFTSESIENLNVFQQGNSLYAAMDVRTICNSTIAFDMESEGNDIKLILKDVSNATADCVCLKKVTTSIINLDQGDYKVSVFNSSNQFLDQKMVTIK